MYSGHVSLETYLAQSDVTRHAPLTPGGQIAASGHPAKRQKTDAHAHGAPRRSVNFHSIADLIGSDEPRSPRHTGFASPRDVIPSPVAPLGKSELLSLPLTVVTTAPTSVTCTMSTDLVITATPPSQKEVPVRPSSTGTCSSANTSLSGSVGYSPNSGDADDSISPTRKGPNTKKGRTIYKAQQVVVLEQVFSRTHYPDADFVERLARDLNISESKIKVWFQNKRARWRRRQARGADDTGSTTPTPVQPFSLIHPLGLTAPESHPVTDFTSGLNPSPFLHSLSAPEAYHLAYMAPPGQFASHIPQSMTSYPLPGTHMAPLPRPELCLPPGGHFVHQNITPGPLDYLPSYHLPSYFGGTLLAK